MSETMTLDEMIEHMKQIASAAEGLAVLRDNGICFEDARDGMMKQWNMPKEQATTQIEALEKLTSIRLNRKDEASEA